MSDRPGLPHARGAADAPRLSLHLGLSAIFACAITTAIALSTGSTGDYVVHGSVGGDNAGPAIDALMHGDLAGYVTHQPAIGLTSLVLRVPFAGIASWVGGGGLLTYRLGAAACLLSLGIFAAWLTAGRRIATRGWLPGLAGAALLLLSPAVRDAVQSGHPEDVLAGVLAAGAAIAATRGHPRWAAIMLGLAVGAKPWAVIAVPPVLVAVPGQRMPTLNIAGGLALLLTAIAPVADPEAFMRSLRVEGAAHVINAFSIWWPLSSPIHLPYGMSTEARVLPLGIPRAVSSMAGLAVACVLLVLTRGYARRSGRGCDPLALLALLGVLRCAIDSTNLEYYYVAALVPLVAWEVLSVGRLPLISALATLAVGLIPTASYNVAPAVLCAASITGTVALVWYLTHRAFHPEAPDRDRRQLEQPSMLQPPNPLPGLR
jgi:hypothetical protein